MKNVNKYKGQVSELSHRDGMYYFLNYFLGLLHRLQILSFK